MTEKEKEKGEGVREFRQRRQEERQHTASPHKNSETSKPTLQNPRQTSLDLERGFIFPPVTCVRLSVFQHFPEHSPPFLTSRLSSIKTGLKTSRLLSLLFLSVGRIITAGQRYLWRCPSDSFPSPGPRQTSFM